MRLRRAHGPSGQCSPQTARVHEHKHLTESPTPSATCATALLLLAWRPLRAPPGACRAARQLPAPDARRIPPSHYNPSQLPAPGPPSRYAARATNTCRHPALSPARPSSRRTSAFAHLPSHAAAAVPAAAAPRLPHFHVSSTPPLPPLCGYPPPHPTPTAA